MKIPQISYNEFTKLPIKEITNMNESGMSLLVKTPMSTEIVEYKIAPLFGADNSYDRPTKEIIYKLLQLEKDSKEFLLDKWISENK